MRLIKVNEDFVLDEVVEILRRCGLVIFPTDTVYGLIADVECQAAVDKVFDVKGRNKEQPIPVLVSCMLMAQKYVVFDSLSLKLWENFMPGQLTLVLPSTGRLGFPVASNEGKIGIRVPNYGPLLRIIDKLGRGVTGTSANFSGQKAAGSASELSGELMSMVDAVVVSDETLMGVSSTVVEVKENVVKVIREGAVSVDKIREVVDEGVQVI